MNKKVKTHTFEEFELEGDDVIELDEIDEILSTDPEIILIQRKDETLGKFGKMAGLKGINPGDLSWDFLLERLPPGEYELVAYKKQKGRGQSIVKRKKILLTSPYDEKEAPIQQFQAPRNDSMMLQAYLDNYSKLMAGILQQRQETTPTDRFEAMADGMKKAFDVWGNLLPKPETPASVINQIKSLVEIQDKIKPKTSWLEQLIPYIEILVERLATQFQNRLPGATATNPAPMGPTQAQPSIQERSFSKEDFENLSLVIFQKYLDRAKRNEDVAFSVDCFVADLEDFVQKGLISIDELQKKIKEIADVSFLSYLKAKLPEYPFDDILPWLNEFRLDLENKYIKEPEPDERTQANQA